MGELKESPLIQIIHQSSSSPSQSTPPLVFIGAGARGLLWAQQRHRVEDRVDYILGELDQLLNDRREMQRGEMERELGYMGNKGNWGEHQVHF